MNTKRIILIGILIGFLLNLIGWLGNNFILKFMWIEVGNLVPYSEWRNSIWRDVFSFFPDFLYGFAIVWLCAHFNTKSKNYFLNGLKAGIFVSLVGGITTYFAIANSGFIPWKLAFASFALVLVTKIPLSIWASNLLMNKV